MGTTDPPSAFDYNGHLDFLEKHHHNFIRLWRWEFPRWKDKADKFSQFRYCAPHPWQRTGAGNANDGKPKFDLTKFDQDYFDRLRTRIVSAGERGIYVSIMLFEGWGLRFASWDGHPFHASNNVNGVNGDPNGDGKGTETHTLQIPAVTRIQEAYLRKVIDTVNDLDNVLYEIANESALLPRTGGSPDWQYHMINYIKSHESTKPKKHPVGMTSQGYSGGDDWDQLIKGAADWISPNPDKHDFKSNPPPAMGLKVILPDTDHLWGIGGGRDWVWKSFLRGHNPIWMDPVHRGTWDHETPVSADNVRRNLGYTRRYAEKMNLAAMTPRSDLASTQYCLADPGKEYLVYLPDGGEVNVDLSAAPGTLAVEWFDPRTGVATDGGTVEAGPKRSLQAPFKGDAVLYLVPSSCPNK
jgi:hypothetical protein